MHHHTRLARLPVRACAFVAMLALACSSDPDPAAGTTSSTTGDTASGSGGDVSLSDAAVTDIATDAAQPADGQPSDALADIKQADAAQPDTTTADTTPPCPEGSACDDGDPCSVQSNCKNGACVAGSLSFCECQQDSDCATKEDGDLCNGTLYCDKQTAFPYACKVNDGTKVTCIAADPTCQTTACVPASGECTVTDVPDGALCDDDDKCTVAGECNGGKCALGINTCACSSDADCPDDDSNPCNGTRYCEKSSHKCLPNAASKIECNKANDTECVANTCDAATGACSLKHVNKHADSSCDDGETCTEADSCVQGKCVGTDTCVCKNDADCEAKKGDGDFCNGTMFCNKVNGLCELNKATIASCPTVLDTPCRANKCLNVFEDKDGVKLATSASCVMVNTLDSLLAACDDNDPCTTGDVCVGGGCKSGTATCFCKSDLDCAAKEDGDKCNGTLFCDKTHENTDGTVQPACVVNPITVVSSCPTVDDTVCKKRRCVPQTGQCELLSEPENKACDDASKCTAGDVCAAGECIGQFICECKQTADCAGFEDGDLCNGTLACNKQTGKCVLDPLSVVTCDPSKDTVCNVATCAPLTGGCYLAAESTQTACDDSNKCTVGDVCNGKGGCKSGTDVCECQTSADCLSKDDGNFCNGVPYCDRTTPGQHKCKPNAASVVICPNVNDSACIKNACDAKTGACHLAKLATGTVCEDSDLCTTSTTCGDGVCANGTYTCDCETNADCLATDDGDLCNGVPYCDTTTPGKHACKPNPASAVHCPQNVNTACLQNRCDAKNGECGLQPFATGKPCTDGDPCTANDGCKAGACAGGGDTDCNDSDVCTDDGCDSKNGCTHLLTNCDDGNTCTVDKCDPKTGKCDFGTKLVDGEACNADGNGCTLNDTCDKGACFSGPPVLCDVGAKACEVALCQNLGPQQYKCVTAQKKDGAACDDESSCTIGSTCKTGKCLSSGAERLWTQRRTFSGTDDYVFPAVGAAGARIMSAGTYVKRATDGTVIKRDLYVEGRDLDGGGTTLAFQKADDPAGITRATAFVPQDGDVTLLIGQTFVGGGPRLLAWKVTSVCKTLSVVRSVLYDDFSANAAVAGADGSIWVTGEASDKDTARIMLARLSSSGQLSAKIRFDATIGALGHAVATMPGNQLVIGGATADLGKGKRYGLLLRSEPGGKVVWQRTYHVNKQDSVLQAVRTDAAGRITAAGSSTGSKAPYGWVLRADETGKELWHRTTVNSLRVYDMHWLAGGEILLAGALDDGQIGDVAWLGLMDPIGNEVWQRPINVVAGAPVTNPARLTQVIPHGDGFAVVGTTIAPKTGQTGGIVGRLAGFGYSTCAAAGACSGKAAGACDDNKPCTLDLCDTKSGKCVHSQLDGLLCDPQDGCTVYGTCQTGACVLDPNGKAWTRNFDWEDVKAPVNSGDRKGVDVLLGLKDGSTAVLGTWQPVGATSKAHGELRRLDHTGALLWKHDHVTDHNTFDAYNDTGKLTGVRPRLLTERNNGELWLTVGRPDKTPGYYNSLIYRVDSDGAVLPMLDWSWPNSDYSHALAAMAEQPDGSSGLVHQQDRGTKGNWFVRRDTDGKVVASSAVSFLPETILAADGNNFALIGTDVYSDTLSAGRLGPSGVVLWSGEHRIDRVNGYHRTVGSSGRLAGDVLHVAGHTWYISGSTHVMKSFVIARLRWSDGKLLGAARIDVPSVPGAPKITIGPHNGFAFFYQVSGSVVLYGSDLAGHLMVKRPLPIAGEFIARRWTATEDAYIWAGRRVHKDGTIQTGVAHTGRWAYSTCTEANLCKSALDDGACDDGNGCTLDVCDADKGCLHPTDTCDDGSTCTIDSCDAKLGCQHKVVVCFDDLPCTQDLCDPLGKGPDGKTGCTFPVIAACNDSQRCTEDICHKDGTCTHPPVNCDDGEPCTINACHVIYGCQSGARSCNDDNPCTFDQCVTGTGCTFTGLPDGSSCEDGKFCKLGVGKCSKLACAIDAIGVPDGCSELKPTKDCGATKTGAKGKLDTYVGPVWFDEDGDGKNIAPQTCDMAAGAFVLRYTDGIERNDTTFAPGDLIWCTGVAVASGQKTGYGWRMPTLQNVAGKPKPTVPFAGKLPVPYDHSAVRVRGHIIVGYNATYSATKTKLNIRVDLDGAKLFDGLIGTLPNTTPGGADWYRIHGCDSMGINGFRVAFDVQAPHTGKTVELGISVSSPENSYVNRALVHGVEIWTK